MMSAWAQVEEDDEFRLTPDSVLLQPLIELTQSDTLTTITATVDSVKLNHLTDSLMQAAQKALKPTTFQPDPIRALWLSFVL